MLKKREHGEGAFFPVAGHGERRFSGTFCTEARAAARQIKAARGKRPAAPSKG